MDGLPFSKKLVIYIKTRNQKVTSKALQEVINKLDVGAVERRITLSTSKTVDIIFRKRNQ